MIDGRELARRIDARKDQLWRDERRLAAAVDDAGRLQTKSRTEEVGAWSQLAAMRLEGDADVLKGRMDASAREASSVLERRARRIDEARSKLADLEDQVGTLSSEHEHAARLASDAAETAASKRREAVEALEEDADCRRAADAVAALEAQAGKAEGKAGAARSELEGKSKPYLAEPMFAYLWERSYGTSTYAGRGLVRILDRWVAGLLGYEKAHTDFRNLNEIPRRLATHADRLRGDLAVARSELDRASRVHTVGAEDAAAEARRLGADAEAAGARLQALRDTLGRHGRELLKAADRKDADWLAAAAALGRSMAGDSLARIEKAAAETPEPEDDLLVAEIRAARARIAEAERVSTSASQNLDRVRKRRKALEAEVEFLASKGWDDADSLFDDELGGTALSQMADGTTTSVAFRIKMQMGRRARGRPVVRDEPSWSRDADSVWGRGGSSESAPERSRPTSQQEDFRTGGGIGGGGGFATGGAIGGAIGAALGGGGAAASEPSDFTTGGDF